MWDLAQRNPLTEKMLIDIPRLAVRWRHCWQLSPGHFWSEKLSYPCLMTYFWPVPRIIFVVVDLPIKAENCLRNTYEEWPLIIDFSSHVKQVFVGCFVYIIWILNMDGNIINLLKNNFSNQKVEKDLVNRYGIFLWQNIFTNILLSLLWLITWSIKSLPGQACWQKFEK